MASQLNYQSYGEYIAATTSALTAQSIQAQVYAQQMGQYTQYSDSVLNAPPKKHYADPMDEAIDKAIEMMKS